MKDKKEPSEIRKELRSKAVKERNDKILSNQKIRLLKNAGVYK